MPILGALGPAQSGGDGTSNRGGGGGAYSPGTSPRGGNGGSGLVIIRFPENFANATTTGLYNVSGGYRVYTFNGTGSIIF